MQQLPFIYSGDPRWRVMRHASFWLLWFLFQLLLYSFSPSPALQRQPFWHRILITLPETLVYLMPSLFLAYTLMYLVIPTLVLPGRYVLAALSLLALVLVTGLFSALLSLTVVDALRHWSADPISPRIAAEAHPPLHIRMGLAVLAGLRGNITVGGIAAAIKLMKCFNEKRQAALLLEKEKAAAELQMLKAQLHPHFLFNTLNNIYSLTQPLPGQASGMILGLSQLLRYILYECNRPLVPLDKEIRMICDYLDLERIRYDQGLDISLDLPRSEGKWYIAPLLLLPFVENAFKHGCSQMTELPWLSLAFHIQGEEFSMKLVNGKPAGRMRTQPGLGLVNVRKRLELLYPGRQELQIVDEEEMYIVNLRLTLSGPAANKEQHHEPATI